MKAAAKPLQERVAELTAQLEAGVKTIFLSGRYDEYLQAMSKFHRYSYGNVILILSQCPHASQVAGYRTWRDEFGRHVKQGEKGIAILAPSTYHRDMEVEQKDPDTGAILQGPDGSPLKETQRVQMTRFVVVYVFDVSQTEGKELPNLGVDELTGDVPDFQPLYDRLAAISPVPIEQREIAGSAKGFFSPLEQRIVIRPGMSQAQTLKTLIHEITHAKLHDPALNDGKKRARGQKEVEAESVAYVVCRHLGLDTSEYSFGYVAGWSKSKELDELKEALSTIQVTAAEIIQAVRPQERELQERSKPKSRAKPKRHHGPDRWKSRHDPAR